MRDLLKRLLRGFFRAFKGLGTLDSAEIRCRKGYFSSLLGLDGLPLGYPEIERVSLAKIATLRGPLGLLV